MALLASVSYLTACTQLASAPAADEGELLGTIGGAEGKSDGPDSIADWNVRKVDGAYLSISGSNATGAPIAHFTIRPVSLFDNDGELLAEGLALTAIAPEVGALEIRSDGQVHTSTLSPRMSAIVEQFLGDMQAAANEGKGDLASFACSATLPSLLVAITAALICPFSVGFSFCAIAGVAGLAAGVSALICLLHGDEPSNS